MLVTQKKQAKANQRICGLHPEIAKEYHAFRDENAALKAQLVAADCELAEQAQAHIKTLADRDRAHAVTIGERDRLQELVRRLEQAPDHNQVGRLREELEATKRQLTSVAEALDETKKSCLDALALVDRWVTYFKRTRLGELVAKSKRVLDVEGY